jgi:two-component system response regulator YesN
MPIPELRFKDRPMRVLVVDDVPSMLELIRSSIEGRFGRRIHVDTESNPLLARSKIEAEVVDVLITDLKMPDMSGLQLLRCAKRRNAWTQVVLMTAYSDVDSLTEAMDLGATDYLTKPIDPDNLEQVVREAYSRLTRWRRSLADTLSGGALPGEDVSSASALQMWNLLLGNH